VLNEEIKLSEGEIVLFVLYELGGWKERIHTEDIALECFRLAPSKFSWVKYPQYPDLMAAWYAIGSAKKIEDGKLLVGGSERKKGTGKDKFGGWRLTNDGIKWIQNNKERIEKKLKGKQNPNIRLLNNIKIKKLLSSRGFQLFREYGIKAQIPYADFVESLTCTVNTKTEVVLEKLEQLYLAANMLNQTEIMGYLDYCRNYVKK